MFAQRIERIRTLLKEKGVDAFLVTSPTNLTYLSGFVCLSPSEREAYILITTKSACILTTPLYAEEMNTNDFSLIILSAKNPLSSVIKSVLEKESLETLGFEEDDIKFFEYERLAKKDIPLVPLHLNDLRTIKDAKEIEKIAHACAIGDKAFEHVLGFIKPGITEQELALELELFIRKQNATLSFPSIIAFGEHAAVPHHQTNSRILKKNEFVLLDFGVKYESYCSDMSRTVYVGTPSTEEKHLYETVHAAQQLAIEYIEKYTIKSSASQADNIARDYIVKQNFPSFPHSLGHGIGLEVHESPSLSPYSQDTLQQGMVFSIEPGIYLEKKAGVRIEDLMVIESNTARLLTTSSRKLIIL